MPPSPWTQNWRHSRLRLRIGRFGWLFGIGRWFHVQLGIIGLLKLLKLLQPILPRFRRREAPLLTGVVPVVGIELLSVMPVLGREFLGAVFIEPHRQFETGVGF